MFTKMLGLIDPKEFVPLKFVMQPFITGSPNGFKFTNTPPIESTLDPLSFRASSQLANGMVLQPINPTYDNLSQVDMYNSIPLENE